MLFALGTLFGVLLTLGLMLLFATAYSQSTKKGKKDAEKQSE